MVERGMERVYMTDYDNLKSYGNGEERARESDDSLDSHTIFSSPPLLPEFRVPHSPCDSRWWRFCLKVLPQNS